MVCLTDRELDFYALCGPLEDAIELLEAGQIVEARTLLQRIVELAKERNGIWKETDAE